MSTTLALEALKLLASSWYDACDVRFGIAHGALVKIAALESEAAQEPVDTGKIIHIERSFTYNGENRNTPWVRVEFPHDDWESRDNFAAAIAQPTPQQATPGWQLVPIEPTAEMLEAAGSLALKATRGMCDRACYLSMLKAAPRSTP